MTSPAADAGLSNWWPTPVRPADHFSADELARSVEIHRPVRRIRRELAMGRVALLAGAGLVIGSDAIGDRLAGPGSVVRSIVGAVAVVAAVRVPELLATRRLDRLDAVQAVDAVDAVERGSAGHPGPVARAGAVLSSVLAIVALALVARFLLGPLTKPATGWMLAITLAAVATVVTMVGTAVRAGRSDAVTTPHPWGDLLHRAGLGAEIGLGLLDQRGDGGAASPNACAVGIAGRRWILVDPSLLAVDAGGTTGDFVVAHEATHLARRHPEIQLAIHAGTLGAALGAIPLLAAVDGPWRAARLQPDDPAGLPIAVLVALLAAAVIRLPAAWILRGLERSADAGAVGLVGVPDRGAMRVLHLQAGGELAPPWWSQVAAVRPSPAERLEYLARCRRSVRASDRPPQPDRAPRPTPPNPSGR